MNKKKIVILSLGWLGLSLYRKLSTDYQVAGAYHTSPKDVDQQFQFDINLEGDYREINEADIIFFNIPPSKINSLEVFESFLKKYSRQRIVFISSTSVYGMQGVVDESTKELPESENGKFLLECEQLLMNRSSVIIRPAGLYGGERHPGKMLSGKIRGIGSKDVINLIDRDNLVSIIEETIENSDNKIINAVNANHPLKKDFYLDYCQKMKLVPPQFEVDEQNTSFKQVDTMISKYKITTDL